MNNELNAVELSDLELETVAGGFAFSIGDGQSLSLGTNSSFGQKMLQVGQATTSGPGGSGTQTMISAGSIFTDASQGFGLGN